MSSNYTQEAVVKAILNKILLNPSDVKICSDERFKFHDVVFRRTTYLFRKPTWQVQWNKHPDYENVMRNGANLSKEENSQLEKMWETLWFEHVNSTKVEQHKRLLRDAGFDNV